MNISVTSPPNLSRRTSTVLGCSETQTGLNSPGPAQRYAEILTSRIANHRGEIFVAEGTLVLAEFEDAADTVNCAISIQEQFRDYNKLSLDQGKIEAGVGVHFGEIFFAEGGYKGSGVEAGRSLATMTPAGKIYITREVFVRIRLLLPLNFESLGQKELQGLSEGKELFSVAWEAVTENLEASLKRLGQDDLQRATRLSTKIGLGASKRASPIVMMLFLLFLFVLFKILKWL
ncbi:MAG TPA: hypothetical protein VMM58_08165 [Bacteroidota bacterium]|nr:hypothetical protein [Bacteroidota bacterium]